MASKQTEEQNIQNESVVDETAVNVLPAVDQMVSKISAQKKISVSQTNIKENVVKMWSYIKYFNSIDEHTQSLFNNATDIELVKIPKEFKDFIVPAAVRFDPADLRSSNLALKDEVKPDHLNLLDFVNLCDEIRGYFKKDSNQDMISLAELKKPVNLTSIIDKASSTVKDSPIYKVNYGNQIYFPIRLKTGLDYLYEDRHFNSTEDSLVKDYLAQFRF